MSPEQYLRELTQSIPVTSNLDVEIAGITDHTVTLKAPLNTHINYEGTAFGGSLNTICILASYLAVHHLFRSQSVKFESLVIQDSHMQYLSPVTKDFLAEAHIENPDFTLKCFKSRGRARASVNCVIKLDRGPDTIFCRFKGRFVIST